MKQLWKILKDIPMQLFPYVEFLLLTSKGMLWQIHFQDGKEKDIFQFRKEFMK